MKPNKPNKSLRTLRDVIGRTQADFAALVGVDPASVTSWERGRRTLQPASAERVSVVTGADPDSLLEGSGMVRDWKGEPYTGVSFRQWLEMHKADNKAGVKRVQRECRWKLEALIKASAIPVRGRRGSLVSLEQSFLQWTREVRKTFRLDRSLRQVLAEPSEMEMEFRVGDLRATPWRAKLFGFEDDPSLKNSDTVLCRFIGRRHWVPPPRDGAIAFNAKPSPAKQ